MTRNVVRSAAVALLLSLAALTATPAHAAPATPVLSAEDVLQQIWGWVTSIFGGGEEAEADHRCTIDPNGCPVSGITIENDHRCTIDPNGGMICGE